MAVIIAACRAVAKHRYQVETIAAGAVFGRYRFATKVRAPLAWFFVSRGRGCLRETPSCGLLHAWHRTFRRPGVALQPGPTVRFPVPGVRKRRGNNHGDPPPATSEHPAEACRDARRPPACGPAPRSLHRTQGSEGIDTGSRSPFPPPGVHERTRRGLPGSLPMRHARIAPPGLSQPYRSGIRCNG